ncbi:MAG: hypothetical protein ACRDOI_22275 [Trebonia sp.]
MGSPVNTSRVGADVDVSHDAVARHIGYLRDSYLLWSCPQTADGAYIRRDRSPEKLYAIDPVIARLSYLRNPARTDVDATILTEMQVGMALRRATFAGGWPWTAAEGKYIETGRWRGEAATVVASDWAGVLTTRNVLDCTDPAGAWAVPAGILAALVDT